MFKDWNTPLVNVIHGSIFVFNVAGGVSNLLNRSLKFALLDFGLALIIVAVNIWLALSRRNLHALQRNLDELLAAMPRITENDMPFTQEAVDKATANLKRVAQLTGATYHETHADLAPLDDPWYSGPYVEITIEGLSYVIAVGHIAVKDATGRRIDSTCYHGIVPMPHAEQIASALLLLKRNPGIYREWRRKDGYYI